ncbi:MAG TPA: hypothetical protein VJ782_11235 [Aeromicrobium sp.]|nr:hypothetical protein [Aeromicrobium sp.]
MGAGIHRRLRWARGHVEPTLGGAVTSGARERSGQRTSGDALGDAITFPIPGGDFKR